MSDLSRPGRLRLDVDRRPDGTAVVSVAGEIDIATVPQLREALDAVAAAAAPGSVAVLDLTRVGFLDSSGLGTLNAARRQAEALGLTWRLAGPQPAVRRILDLTGVISVFAVYPDLGSAVAGGPVELQPDRGRRA